MPNWICGSRCDWQEDEEEEEVDNDFVGWIVWEEGLGLVICIA
jgi:hypothetical protein